MTETAQKRARRIATKLIDQVLDERFLRYRHEQKLGNDLTIIAVLLISGLSEQWLTPELFFKLTYDVWVHLFFDHGSPEEDGGEVKGWLQLRSDIAKNPLIFRQTIGTVPLTSALTVWSFMCPSTKLKLELARYILATRLAVARLPWLWNLDRIDDVADEISRIVTRTGWLSSDFDRGWNIIKKKWNHLMSEGLALGRFEHVLKEHSPAKWREHIHHNSIKAGTLVWQGKLGFGVTMEKADCKVDATSAIPVLLLKAGKRQANINASYLLPVHLLLQILTETEASFSPDDSETLGRFVEQLESLVPSEKHL